MTGYRTLIFGLLVAIGPAGLMYLAGIDWTHYVNPVLAPFVVGGITMLLRYLTTTPIGTAPKT